MWGQKKYNFEELIKIVQEVTRGKVGNGKKIKLNFLMVDSTLKAGDFPPSKVFFCDTGIFFSIKMASERFTTIEIKKNF